MLTLTRAELDAAFEKMKEEAGQFKPDLFYVTKPYWDFLQDPAGEEETLP